MSAQERPRRNRPGKKSPTDALLPINCLIAAEGLTLYLAFQTRKTSPRERTLCMRLVVHCKGWRENIPTSPRSAICRNELKVA
jgi:hypothetical protein